LVENQRKTRVSIYPKVAIKGSVFSKIMIISLLEPLPSFSKGETFLVDNHNFTWNLRLMGFKKIQKAYKAIRIL
jgi:hypothetical protein